MIFLGAIAIIIGLVNLFVPTLGWRASKWQYRNAENVEVRPEVVLSIRIGAVVLMLIGVVGIVMGAMK